MFTWHDVLSKEEWEKAVSTVENIPIETDCRWWLRSQGSVTQTTAYVSKDGEINAAGTHVDTRVICVRPAFRIPHLVPNNYKSGEKVLIGKTKCTMIAFDTVLADEVICFKRFDHTDNNYDTSEIKEYINSNAFRELL